MAGERDLSKLLAGLSPCLRDNIYVFVTVPDPQELSHITPLLQFVEEEGVTAILKKEDAEKAGLPYTFPCRQITLTVHSALDAAGMMAAVSTALASRNIPVNPVAGYYHDHLFVPEERAEEALAVLQKLQP
ncbi:MAG: ACT domain-containing protein [Pseudomonadota bacterium]